jgi:DNA-binding transcriptional regulator YhcF (GntR family)
METMGLCYTERGLGTFMTQEESVIWQLRRDMADQMIRQFVNEMSALGFSPEEMKKAIDEEIK